MAPLGNGTQGAKFAIGAVSLLLGATIAAHTVRAGAATVRTANGIDALAGAVRNNGGRPTDLKNDGATPNDVGYGDTGPKTLLNFPENATRRACWLFLRHP